MIYQLSRLLKHLSNNVGEKNKWPTALSDLTNVQERKIRRSQERKIWQMGCLQTATNVITNNCLKRAATVGRRCWLRILCWLYIDRKNETVLLSSENGVQSIRKTKEQRGDVSIISTASYNDMLTSTKPTHLSLEHKLQLPTLPHNKVWTSTWSNNSTGSTVDRPNKTTGDKTLATDLPMFVYLSLLHFHNTFNLGGWGAQRNPTITLPSVLSPSPFHQTLSSICIYTEA